MSIPVDDFDIPTAPAHGLDALIAYLGGPFIQSRAAIRDLMNESRGFRNKATVIQLGYEALLFRSELDGWLAYANQLLDAEKGEQLSVAHGSQPAEGRKASTEYLKAQAGIFIAPLKRAHQELKDTQDLLNKTISWCQTQQKTIATDEYGDLFAASNEVPEQMYSDAPSAADSLKKN